MRKALRKEVAAVVGIAALGCWLAKKKAPAACLGAGAAGLWLSTRLQTDSFRHQTVMITGGSRGLGLALASELLKDGSRVSLLARDEEELKRAREILLRERPTAQILLCVCDVTNLDQLRDAFRRTEATLGPIDTLINDAGSILVGPFESFSREDFDAQLELHLHAIINAVRLALPRFRRRPGGRIVNICSVGGKIAVPHMLTYDTSKFALAGFSQGLAAELAHEGISVTTAYPIVMRTGSPRQAVFKGFSDREFSWFAAIDHMPFVSQHPRVVARKILRAALDRQSELVTSPLGKARIIFGAFFPETALAAMGFAARFLPKGKTRYGRTGAASRERFDRSIWMKPFKYWENRSAQEWNQKPKFDARRNAGLKPRVQ